MDEELREYLVRTLGAVVFAGGLLRVHQNNLLKDNKAVSALSEGNIGAAQQAAEKTGKAATKPLVIPGGAVSVSDERKPAVNTWALPTTGLLLLVNGVFYFGWKPMRVTIPGRRWRSSVRRSEYPKSAPWQPNT